MFIKNKKGQIAIFVVLIFQVLFICFAMTINIALVVHDKINLQNSLDLATYYGAKKQAEVLNAMAHINYQMRQNWKLLTWRYRILGTLNQDKGGGDSYWCPQNKKEDTICNSSKPSKNYFLCISSSLWKRGIKSSDEDLCRTIDHGVRPIDLIPPVSVLQVAHIAYTQAIRLRKQLARACNKEGALNWLTVQIFLTHFRLDQYDRTAMLKKIYEKSLKVGKDLDGEDIFEGAKKVFFKNLSFANRKNVKDKEDYYLKEFNSFKDKQFEAVFERIETFPLLQYWHSSEDRPGGCDSNRSAHFQMDSNQAIGHLVPHPLAQPEWFNNTAKGLFDSNGPRSPEDKEENEKDRFNLGFIKKPKKILYYALKIDFSYSPEYQIFSLKNEIKFKASAFAKAFGGRFGPSKDPLIPLPPTQGFTTDKDFSQYQPNYSRYPGDTLGLLDRKLHEGNTAFLKKRSTVRRPGYNIEDFLHLIFYDSDTRDPLALPEENSNNSDKLPFIRAMELMAVYPDAYDLSYYSILSNYMQTYYPKICRLISKLPSKCKDGKASEINTGDNKYLRYLREDFGWPPRNHNALLEMNLNPPASIALSIAPYFLKNGDSIDLNKIKRPPLQPNPLEVTELTNPKIYYPWLAKKLPHHLLNSWSGDSKNNKVFECLIQSNDEGPIPSSCAHGGRNAYSVKLISCEIVKKMDNQPGNFKEYCPN